MKQSSHNKNIIQLFFFGMVSSLFVLVLLNAWVAQQVSPTYLQFMKQNPQATVEFLKRIPRLPEFNQISANVQELNQQYRTQVEAEDQKRKKEIDALEQLLTQNSQSRDVLFALATLYHQAGNGQKAQQYLQQAQQIDPNLELNL